MALDTAYASVRRADVEDHQAVLDVLAVAFMNDPVACWAFPAAGERGRLQPRFYRALLSHPAGEAYLVGRREGASVWLTLAAGQTLSGEHPVYEGRPDAPETGPDAGSDMGFSEIGARARALDEALAERHPAHEPHLYLPCIGVVGERRGAGLGSAMLRHRLARADADGLGTYLEASSPRSRALYLRYGFENLGEPLRVADSPLLWPMWRPPSR
ncbi:GNAT family N-acetyltransferase [Nonomuraea sp. NPDC050022]|uniref:GNAT family N-acetyltransferase n=1 Tax=unclassified Nonomuraea TaxID=2593643 RepID=UPI0033C6EF79